MPTPKELFDLAYYGNADALDAYLTAGHDINHIKSGAYIGTLLNRAANMNNIPMAERLLSNNPKPNIEATALSYAVCTEDGDTRMLSLLLNHQANVNIKDDSGPLLHQATGKIQHLTLLLNHGADVDAVNHYGMTALHSIKYREEEEEVITAVTSLLLEHGANPFIKNHHGGTAADAPEVKAHMNWLVGQVVERATEINAAMSPLLTPHLIPDLANMVNEYHGYNGNIGEVSIASLSKNPKKEPNPERKAQLERQQLVLKDVLGAYAQTKKEEREKKAEKKAFSAFQAIFSPFTLSSPQWRERIAPTRSASAPLPSSSQGR